MHLMASACFASCNRSDPSVLVAHVVGLKYLKYWYSSWKTQPLKNNEETYSATFTVMLYKAGNIHYHCFSWNGTFNGLTSTCPLTTPTKNHPQDFNYCNLSISTHKISKVHTKHSNITVILMPTEHDNSPLFIFWTSHFSFLCHSDLVATLKYTTVAMSSLAKSKFASLLALLD